MKGICLQVVSSLVIVVSSPVQGAILPVTSLRYLPAVYYIWVAIARLICLYG